MSETPDEPSSTPPTPPSGTKSAQHGRLRFPKLTLAGKIVASVVAVAIVSGGIVGGIAIADINSGRNAPVQLQALPTSTATTSHTARPKPTPKPKPTPTLPNPATGPIDLLIAGTDTRSGQGAAFSDTADQLASSGAGNNDVTMLIQVAANHLSARIVSFPRDLELPIPACPAPGGGSYSAESQAMLNTTLSIGGLSCVVTTVQSLTGVTIPMAAEISFDGVAAMATAVGGVPVCIATPIDDPYTGLVLSAGPHSVSGAGALAFVRTRHGVGDGSDIGRISNQQLFLSSLLRKLAAQSTLDNPSSMYMIAKTAAKSMTFSTSLDSVDKLISVARTLRAIPLQDITFIQYPTVADPSATSRVIPDSYSASVLDAALKANQPVKLTGPTGRASTLASKQVKPKGPAPVRNPQPVATLPSSITGQTANQDTCTLGQTG